MKRLVSAVLAAMLLVMCAGTSAVFAGAEYNLCVSFDDSLGGVQITTSGGQTYTAVPPESSVWNPTKNMPKGTEFDVLNGAAVVSAAGEDFTYAAASTVTIDSYTFNSTIKGSNNGSVSESGVTGNVIKVDCKKSGIMYIAVNLNVGKGVKAVNTNDIGNLLVDYTADVAGNYLLPFSVEAGQSYYYWGVGTKPYFYGLVFESSVPMTVNAGDTVTIKSAPGENAWIGNVSLEDSDVELVKNSGYTECTFVMPQKNINVSVDFINKSVQNETSGITFDMIKGLNTSEDNIMEDLNLIQGFGFSIGYADVRWESSNPDIISISGIVNTDNESHSVTMTAVCTFQDYPNLRITKDFNLSVPADTDDVGAVAVAKEALDIGDVSAVKSNLELPNTGRRGTTITWSSSAPEVVSVDGVVNRQKGVDKVVTLTALISRGEAKDTKTFEANVLGYTAVEISRVAVSNSEGRVVIAPTDGGYVSHIVYTDSISDADRTGEETLVVAVYDKEDNGILTACKLFNLKETTKTVGEETILYLNPEDIPVSSNSEIKIFAFENMNSVEPFMNEPYTYGQTVANNATIYVAGDSTACVYTTSGSKNGFPRTGWAQVLGDFFTGGVTVKDLALSGRSSLNFRDEANYRTIINGLKPGDYFIVQFGHNDSKSDDSTRYTNPVGDRFTDGTYKNSIYEYYVKPALDKGAYPLITTSISRNRLSDAGLEAYVNAAKELAQELGLPYIDLYAKTNGYINKVGTEKAYDVFAYIKSNDSRFVKGAPLPESFKNSLGKSTIDQIGDFANSQYVSGGTDNTHIQYYGAQMISQWACDELEAIGHPLTSKRSVHVMTLDDLPSYADATSVK